MLKDNIYCSISFLKRGNEVDPENSTFKPIRSDSRTESARSVGRHGALKQGERKSNSILHPAKGLSQHHGKLN